MYTGAKIVQGNKTIAFRFIFPIKQKENYCTRSSFSIIKLLQNYKIPESGDPWMGFLESVLSITLITF